MNALETLLVKPLIDIGAHIVIFLVGWLLFVVGNRLLGHTNDGGKRLVLFVGGFAFAAFGRFACRELWHAFETDQFPDAFGFYLGVGCICLGLYLLGASLFASGKALDKAFDVLGGI